MTLTWRPCKYVGSPTSSRAHSDGLLAEALTHDVELEPDVMHDLSSITLMLPIWTKYEPLAASPKYMQTFPGHPSLLGLPTMGELRIPPCPPGPKRAALNIVFPAAGGSTS